MTFKSEKKVGKLIRIELDEETGVVHMVIEITDSVFKARVLHNKDIQDIITIKGKDIIQIDGDDADAQYKYKKMAHSETGRMGRASVHCHHTSFTISPRNKN